MKPPSEKTLELNIISNMVDNIRRRFPRAFAYGFSLQYEKSTGIDSTLEANILGKSTIVAFQFKRPHYKLKNGDYAFSINNNSDHNQHNFLRRVAIRQGRRGRFSVFYALPCFVDIQEVSFNSPNFLGRTVLLDPYYINPLNKKTHSIHLDFGRRRYSVHSEAKNYSSGGLITWEELERKINEQSVGESIDGFVKYLNIPAPKEEEEHLGPVEDSCVSLKALIL